jgi:hypothetical protein
MGWAARVVPCGSTGRWCSSRPSCAASAGARSGWAVGVVDRGCWRRACYAHAAREASHNQYARARTPSTGANRTPYRRRRTRVRSAANGTLRPARREDNRWTTLNLRRSDRVLPPVSRASNRMAEPTGTLSASPARNRPTNQPDGEASGPLPDCRRPTRRTKLLEMTRSSILAFTAAAVMLAGCGEQKPVTRTVPGDFLGYKLAELPRGYGVKCPAAMQARHSGSGTESRSVGPPRTSLLGRSRRRRQSAASRRAGHFVDRCSAVAPPGTFRSLPPKGPCSSPMPGHAVEAKLLQRRSGT